jgi:hypothetical protein
LPLLLAAADIPAMQEAQAAANWAFHPPLGHRSNGGGGANMWSKLSGGNYRQTINDNLI